nr:MAG TPA: hypothetical protein [Caudoviricetes sp.]
MTNEGDGHWKNSHQVKSRHERNSRTMTFVGS